MDPTQGWRKEEERIVSPGGDRETVKLGETTDLADLAPKRILPHSRVLHDGGEGLELFDFNDGEKIRTRHREVRADRVRNDQPGLLHLGLHNVGDEGLTERKRRSSASRTFPGRHCD